MKRGSIEVLPIHFIRSAHSWLDIVKDDDEDGYVRFIGARCQECSLSAFQDYGSLAYFVVDGNKELAELSCEEIQIKSIIE